MATESYANKHFTLSEIFYLCTNELPPFRFSLWLLYKLRKMYTAYTFCISQLLFCMGNLLGSNVCKLNFDNDIAFCILKSIAMCVDWSSPVSACCLYWPYESLLWCCSQNPGKDLDQISVKMYNTVLETSTSGIADELSSHWAEAFETKTVTFALGIGLILWNFKCAVQNPVHTALQRASTYRNIRSCGLWRVQKSFISQYQKNMSSLI